MAKVKIQGHASGTGVLTVTAPNTSTDRTITLPDGTGSLIADNGSGQVGIGTTTHHDATTKLTVAGRINTTNGTATGSMNYGGGAVVNMGALTNHPVNLMVNNSTKWLIDTNGNLVAEGGGGIVLGNTSYAAANELDDYEEGTWTPAYTPQGGSFGISYVGAIPGRYVKIGKQVTCWFYIGTDGVNTSAATGDNVYLTGLPFAAENVSAGVWGTAVYSEKWSGENPTHAVISSTESRLQLFYRSTVNGSSNNRSKYVDMGTGGDSNYVRGFITYTV